MCQLNNYLLYGKIQLGDFMNILVVNDDGINAVGIKKLAYALKKYGNVTISAPNQGRSASGHSIVLHGTLSYEYMGRKDDIEWYQTNGTPADCVRLAFGLIDTKFDVVFSGINNGLNIGTDIIYSGTVAAAREANIEFVPSVAVSTDFDSFEIVDKELDVVLEKIFKEKLYSVDYTLNVNFPVSGYKKSLGFKYCRQGVKNFKTKFVKTNDGSYINTDSDIVYDSNPDTDVYLAGKGYITIVPLKVEQTSYNDLKKLIEEK